MDDDRPPAEKASTSLLFDSQTIELESPSCLVGSTSASSDRTQERLISASIRLVDRPGGQDAVVLVKLLSRLFGHNRVHIRRWNCPLLVSNLEGRTNERPLLFESRPSQMSALSITASASGSSRPSEKNPSASVCVYRDCNVARPGRHVCSRAIQLPGSVSITKRERERVHFASFWLREPY